MGRKICIERWDLILHIAVIAMATIVRIVAAVNIAAAAAADHY